MALYHYTTESRFGNITSDGKLLPSMDTMHDAACGIGWYFTDLSPLTCEKIIMGYCWQKTTLHRRVDYYFQISVNDSQVYQVPGRPHVLFVPYSNKVSFNILSSGETPECDKKPCYNCDQNPEKVN